MKVLVIGQGGREHALVCKLAESPLVSEVLCAPGNGGTSDVARNIDCSATDVNRLVKLAQAENVGLTVVGPEAPLVAGVCDAFRKAGLTVFGPSQAAAQLEGSKVFAKEILRKANVPTADWHVFKKPQEARDFLNDRDDQAWVVKADGLAAGKGVFVCANKGEALAAVAEVMEDRTFGEAGDRIIVEERLVGQEASILAIVDGTTIIPLEASQDHKAAFDDDQGPNTGGMGAYCPTPLITPARMDEIIDRILVPTVHTMKKTGNPFQGVLYAGLMITNQGPKVLEFNVRFGDPETQPVLFRLKSDLAQLLLSAAKGELNDVADLEWDPRPAVCVVMAAAGYPGSYEKGKPIRGIAEADALPDVKVFHAGTTRVGDTIVTDGGRVLGVTALGDNIADAKRRAYQAVKCIRWDGAWCRKDISDKARLEPTGE